MPFYFRKSVSAGPFRFNFSSGGVGVSIGVKGLRVGTGPRGHYVQAGRGGFYYRATLPGSGTSRRAPARASGIRPSSSLVDDDMVVVTSSDVLAMQDAAFSDLLEDINGRNRQARLATTLGLMAAGLWAVCYIVVGNATLPGLGVVMLAWAVGAWLDSFRRVVVLYYEVDGAEDSPYARLCAAFDGLAACLGKWHLEAGKSVHDLTTWKREAGASHLVRRKPTTVSYALPAIVRCNVVPPVLSVGGRTFHFLPDVVLVRDATGFGATGYDSLRITSQPANFIETDGVPGDAVISHYTWQHPNKSGGPDRRFANNRQIPVCRYEAMHLGSAGGINELLEFSKLGVVQPLGDAVAAIPKNRSLDEKRLLPRPDDEKNASPITETGRPQDGGNGATVAAAGLAMAIAAALTIYLLPHHPPGSSIAPPASAPAEVAAIDEQVYVMPPQLNCRDRPASDGAVVEAYDQRRSVHVSAREGDWLKIERLGGDCWMSARFLGSAPPPAVMHSRGRLHHRHGHRRS